MKITIPLSEISELGTQRTFDDQTIWLNPIKEFRLSCSIAEPVKATCYFLKQADGCLIQGNISGRVKIPCDRCGESAFYDISSDFDDFEQVPGAFQTSQDAASETTGCEPSLIFYDKHNILRLDIGSFLWEEFSLALPMQSLCKEKCKGICNVCGTNRNLQDCNCDRSNTDPRLDKLKNLKINTQT